MGKVLRQASHTSIFGLPFKPRPAQPYHTGRGEMLVQRVEAWAESQPQALAVEPHGEEFTYQQFLSPIAASQAPLLAQGREAPATAVILTRDLLDSWIMSLAVRALPRSAINSTPTKTRPAAMPMSAFEQEEDQTRYRLAATTAALSGEVVDSFKMPPDEPL